MTTPAVALAGVAKTFRPRSGRVQALAPVDLTVTPGEFVALLGPSGCGKSTLLRVIGGLIEPDAGDVRVFADRAADARAAKHIGLVPQQPALLPWLSVRRNAGLLSGLNGGSYRKADVDALLDEVGLLAFADALPHQLSGGMQQRVGLVRAFALGAPLLLMDEPFAALDEIAREHARELLLRLWDQHRTTVVFVTHSVTEAVVLADRVLVMSPRPGRIVADIPVGLPRPRVAEVEDTVAFLEAATTVRRALRGAVA
jgi:NitT/TauT family transport system ATP-binding protein